jgi:hypothetical protein
MAGTIKVHESKDGGPRITNDREGVAAVSADVNDYEGGTLQLIQDIAYYDDGLEVTENDDGSITIGPAPGA